MHFDFSEINFLAVIVAAVAAFALGFLWYSVLFGKPWQKELGFTDEYIQQGNMGKIFGTSFLMMVIMSLGLALMFSGMPADQVNWRSGLHTGLMVGLFFSATSIGINYLYQRRSIKLWLIDASYQILFLGVEGIILAIWR